MKNTAEVGTRGYRKMRRIALRMAAAVMLFAVTGAARAESVQEQRDDIRATVNDTLNRLYAAQPSAKQAIAKARGTAFSTISA